MSRCLGSQSVPFLAHALSYTDSSAGRLGPFRAETVWDLFAESHSCNRYLIRLWALVTSTLNITIWSLWSQEILRGAHHAHQSWEDD